MAHSLLQGFSSILVFQHSNNNQLQLLVFCIQHSLCKSKETYNLCPNPRCQKIQMYDLMMGVTRRIISLKIKGLPNVKMMAYPLWSNPWSRGLRLSSQRPEGPDVTKWQRPSICHGKDQSPFWQMIIHDSIFNKQGTESAAPRN